MLQEVPIDKIKVPMNNTIKTAELMDQNTMSLDMVNKISKKGKLDLSKSNQYFNDKVS